MEKARTKIRRGSIMVAHVLGNGSSICFFDRTRCDGIIIGCNFSDENLQPAYTVIVDSKPIMKIIEGFDLKIPVVLTDRANEFMLTQRGGWDNLRDGAIKVKEVVPLLHWKELSKDRAMNSAQIAVMYAIEKEGASDIHLWGINSFWEDDIRSHTHKIVLKDLSQPNISIKTADIWRVYWKAIFERHPQVNFIVHGPTGVHSIINAHNYTFAVHERSSGDLNWPA